MMIEVNVLYPHTPGKNFDGAYYRDKHMPMVKETLAPACKGIAYKAGLSGAQPGSAPTYIAVGTLYFDSVEDFATAWGPHAAKIVADIPNYTDIEPIIEIDEVRLFDAPAGATV